MAKRTFVALLRAIGPVTHRVMSMRALAEACRTEGLGQVRTVLATGNVVFESDRDAADLSALFVGIVAGFGLGRQNVAVIREIADVQAALAAVPFVDAARERPSRMLIVFLDRAPDQAAVAPIEAWPGPERVKLVGRDVMIDFRDGVVGSKLQTAFLERRLGVVATARNVTTCARIIDATRRGNEG